MASSTAPSAAADARELARPALTAKWDQSASDLDRALSASENLFIGLHNEDMHAVLPADEDDARAAYAQIRSAVQALQRITAATAWRASR